MDKVVDHILVFNGDGDVKDFPGNYSQYREWKKEQQAVQSSSPKGKNDKDAKQTEPSSSDGRNQNRQRKLTFKEKREFEQLELDIEALNKEKEDINAALCGGTTDIDEITRLSKRLPLLNEELDEKEMRWLELSEFC